MKLAFGGMVIGAALAVALPSSAAAADDPAPLSGPAIGADLFFSTDADDTDVVRLGSNLDFRHEGPEDYLGVRFEQAWFNPVGSGWRGMQRAYVRGAAPIGKWEGAASIGSDGRTLLGSATIHDEAKFRKEFFVERDIVETRRGVDKGIYYTFAGAAIDLSADDRNILTLVGGVQEFTGSNVRTHLRATYVHVLNPDRGLSLQLRARYFRDSDPREYDYYSPRWYAQAVPVLQWRRFQGGWQYLLAGGVGVQRDNNTKWHRSSYLNAQIHSPERNRWSVNASATFSETPTTSGQSYNYLQMTVGILRRF